MGFKDDIKQKDDWNLLMYYASFHAETTDHFKNEENHREKFLTAQNEILKRMKESD